MYGLSMPKKTGTAKYTAHVSTNVTPEVKQWLLDEADRNEVAYGVVVRWALNEYQSLHSVGAKDAEGGEDG
jgi:hypothetical protein